ncbi:MAG: choice-of-anchor Q domain-containing protein [Verrucomicrobiota bacterium]
MMKPGSLPLLCRSALLSLALSVPQSMPGAGTVTNADESSLRAALAGGGAVMFDCDGTIALTNTLVIRANTVFDASGHSITLDGQQSVRVLSVSNASLTLLHVTVANGLATGTNGVASQPAGAGQGGGIDVQYGQLAALDCRFVSNSVRGGPGGTNDPYNDSAVVGAGGPGHGGAIRISNGTLTVSNTVFQDNVAAGGNAVNLNGGNSGDAFGGAIHAADSTTLLANSRFESNLAQGGSSLFTPSLMAYGGDFGGGNGGAISTVRGSVRLTDCAFQGNQGRTVVYAWSRFSSGHAGRGGAVLNNGGSLQVSGCTFASNTVKGASACSYHGTPGPGQGGAICSAGPLQVLRSCFSGNQSAGGDVGSADGDGGAVHSDAFTRIEQCRFDGNQAVGGAGTTMANLGFWGGQGLGGAIAGSGEFVILGTTFTSNRVDGAYPSSAGVPPANARGGAVYVTGLCNLTNCTLTGNVAAGAATYLNTGSYWPNGADGFGGGICNDGGTLISVNNTLTLNDALGGAGLTNGNAYGGAIASINGQTLMINTVLANSPGSSNCFGLLTDGGYNLSSDASCQFTNAGSLNNTNPLLAPLADNGGPTPTHALLPGSPAIDAADDVAAPIADQRGMLRPVGPHSDIGAFEYASYDPPCVYSVDTTNVTCSAAAQTAGVTVIAGYYCDWTAAGGADWITLSPTNGSGIIPISVKLAANTGLLPRQVSLTVAGQTVLVSQAGTDLTPPRVTIASPASFARSTSPFVLVTGSATDDASGVGSVEFRVENALGTNSYSTASGTTSWSALATNLVPGTNVVRVRACDLAGNVTTNPPSVTVFYVQTSPLTILNPGGAKLKPDLSGHSLEIGKTYTITASGTGGTLFDSWWQNSQLLSRDARLTFQMQDGLVLRVSVVAYPFGPAVGSYEGLFYDTNGVEIDSAGFIKATVNGKGQLNGKLISAGKSYSLKGQFRSDGAWSNSIPRNNSTPLQMVLQLDLYHADRITGHVTDGNWTAELTANRNPYSSSTNPAPQAGNYTLVIPADSGGNSYGSVQIDMAGRVKFNGKTGHGTAISQNTILSAQGQWPLYVSLQSGKELLMGWLTVYNRTILLGTVDWIQLPVPQSRWYQDGFTNQSFVMGSALIYTPGNPLDFDYGDAWFEDRLVAHYAYWVSDSQMAGANRFNLTINKGTGLFKGSVLDTDSGRVLPFDGAVLQGYGRGYGRFAGTNGNGNFTLSSATTTVEGGSGGGGVIIVFPPVDLTPIGPLPQ